MISQRSSTVGDADVDHLNRRQLVQDRRRGQSGGIRLHAVLQGDLQTVGQERQQDVRVGAVFELMMDGADAQVALERAKGGLNLRQLHIPGPQDGRVFGGQVGAE
jgi:hypothetical protein